MKNVVIVSFALTLLTVFSGRASMLDLTKISDGKTWTLSHATAESVEMDGRKAVRLTAEGDSATGIAGLAWANGVEFTTGAIELDLKGRNERQRCFLGVAFNIVDERTFEGVYFRPFNFNAAEPFRLRGVQYVAWPEHTWEQLRKDKPGQFEKPVNPVPDPDGWFHARIELSDKQVQVFVNGAKEPCLTVSRLAEGRARRPVGLFVDSHDGLYANLEVTPAK